MSRTSAKQRKIDEKIAAKRGIVNAFPAHGDVYLIACALEMYARVLTRLDAPYPDEERRVDAARAEELAEWFYQANMARDYIERKDES